MGEVKADVSQLEQVIAKLIVNARGAKPVGGELSVETARIGMGQGQDVATGEWLVWSVRGDGDGGGGVAEWGGGRVWDSRRRTA